MEKEVGIKETKELVIAINQVGLKVLELAQDGLDLKDAADLAVEIANNKELKDALALAVEDFQKIPEEFKDLSFKEAIDLASVQVQFIPEILKAIEGKPA